MYGHKLWQSPAIGRAGRANFGSLDQTGSKTITLVYKNYVSSMDSKKYIQMQTDINNFIYAMIVICTKMTKQLKL